MNVRKNMLFTLLNSDNLTLSEVKFEGMFTIVLTVKIYRFYNFTESVYGID